MIALRTQQIIAEETGIANVVDPLGGSYFVEALTTKIENEAMALIQKIDEMGGMIAAVEKGYPQAEIAQSAYHFQKLFEAKQKTMVGVNKYQAKEEKRTIDTLYIDRSLEKNQILKLEAIKKSRNAQNHSQSLRQLKESAEAGKNLCGPIQEAVAQMATLQEVCDTLRGVYGEYRESGSF
jgi:methylmalonyl-CoA mutase N-terminal domain/subunit